MLRVLVVLLIFYVAVAAFGLLTRLLGRGRRQQPEVEDREHQQPWQGRDIVDADYKDID